MHFRSVSLTGNVTIDGFHYPAPWVWNDRTLLLAASCIRCNKPIIPIFISPLYEERGWRMINEMTLLSTKWCMIELYVEVTPNMSGLSLQYNPVCLPYVANNIGMRSRLAGNNDRRTHQTPIEYQSPIHLSWIKHFWLTWQLATWNKLGIFYVYSSRGDYDAGGYVERDDDDNVDEENWGIARKMRTRMLNPVQSLWWVITEDLCL